MANARETDVTQRAATLRYLLAMVSVLALAALLVAGPEGVAWTALAAAVAVATAPRLPVTQIMRLQGSIPMPPGLATDLEHAAPILARKAGLTRPPALYLQLRGGALAFSTGDAHNGAVAISRGLLRLLRPDELEAVLAHEIAHLASGDIRIMRMAEVIATATRMVTMAGLFIVLWVEISHPDAAVSPWMVIYFALAPAGVVMLQRAHERGREFAADARAADLTGDGAALARALIKIDDVTMGPFRQFGRAAGMMLLPRFLQSHPSARQRVERLLKRP